MTTGRTGMARRTAMLGGMWAALLALCLAATGCIHVTREEGAPYIPPPEDLLRQRYESEFKRVGEAELQMPPPREYLIGPGDKLSLAFVGRPDLLPIRDEGSAYTITVTESPTIVLPYVGEVAVHGKTVGQVQEELRQAYLPYVKDPVPIVRIEEFFYNQVTVIGSVGSAGSYPMLPGDTVVDLLFKAGGLSLTGRTGAPARVLKIYRQKLTQRERMSMPPEEIIAALREDGRIIPREEILIPLEEFLIGGDLSYNIPVQADDIIFIPPAGTVMVTGDVERPGVVFMGPSLRTLVHVLTVTDLAFRAASVVEVVRTNPDGTQDNYFLHARRMLRRKEPDFYLQDNDQVFVYRAGWRTAAQVISDFFQFGVKVTTGVSGVYDPTDNNNNN